MCSIPPPIFAGSPCKKVQTREYDLTTSFDKLEIEKGTDGLIADVLLSSEKNDEQMLVEIAVTHLCDEEKIASKKRILEYSVQSEEDLEQLKTPFVDIASSGVTTYNISPKERTEEICRQGQCDRPVSVFVVYDSYKSITQDMEYHKARKLTTRPDVIHHKIEKASASTSYKELVRESFFSGVEIKNCYLCKYHGRETYYHPVFCRSLKRGVKVHEAVDCSHYRPFANIQECESADKANAEYVGKTRTKREYTKRDDDVRTEKHYP